MARSMVRWFDKEYAMKSLVSKRDARKKPTRTMKEKKAEKKAKKAARDSLVHS
jgi:hypothetical protein